MKAFTKVRIIGATTVLCVPFVRVESRIEVDVNWSIQQPAPTDHTVTIRELSFTVPAGQSVKQSIPLKGGANVAAVYAVRGWGFVGQQLKVDGKEVPLDRIKTANKRGAWRILGFGRAAVMDAKIVM